MRKRRTMQILAVTAAAALLAGCSATELEDRCFPMMAAVDYRLELTEFSYGFPELSQEENTDVEESKVNASIAYGEDFWQSYETYEQELSKLADCNHMKVLLLGRSFLQSEQCDAMLTCLRETELFPRNTYVCVTEDTHDLFEIEGDLPEDLGTYLESYLQRHQKERGMTLPDLGKLLDAKENGEEQVALPFLVVEDGAVIWEAEICYETAP